jgi:hypothetical protein
MLTSCAAINRELVSHTFRFRRLSQETEPAACDEGNEECEADILLGVGAGIPLVGSDKVFEYYIIRSRDMAENERMRR